MTNANCVWCSGDGVIERRLDKAIVKCACQSEQESIDKDELARLQKVDWCVKENRIDLVSKEWLPMYTAPKDGQIILVLWNNIVMPATYLDNSKTDVPWQGWKPIGMQPWPAKYPDCWQPMPKPPLSKIEAEDSK